MAVSDSFKALIIKNFRTGKPSGDLMVKSFTENIRQAVPEARVDVFGAADGDPFPDATSYDLIILSGGTVNLLEEEKPAWAVSILDLVRRLSLQTKTKLVGICWGHQATHYALGGQLGLLEGPRIGVQETELTEDGRTFFGTHSLNLHKYHKRIVSVLAPDFVALASGNEMTISKSNNIITLQGHPELNYETSRSLRDNDDGSYAVKQSGSEPNVTLKDITASHEGQKVWVDIMKWATS